MGFCGGWGTTRAPLELTLEAGFFSLSGHDFRIACTLAQGLPSHGPGIVSPGTVLSGSDELEHAGAERVAAPAEKPRLQCKL